MDDLEIGDVARRAGIRPSAVRYYERIGLLAEPRRVGGRRRYGPETVQQVKVIQLAQAAGFRIAEIAVLLHGFAADTPPAVRWQHMSHAKLRELDALIARTQQMQQMLQTGLRCSCRRLEDCAVVLEAGGGAAT